MGGKVDDMAAKFNGVFLVFFVSQKLGYYGILLTTIAYK